MLYTGKTNWIAVSALIVGLVEIIQMLINVFVWNVAFGSKKMIKKKQIVMNHDHL